MTGYLFRRLWQSLLVLFGDLDHHFRYPFTSPATRRSCSCPRKRPRKDIDNFRKLMGFKRPALCPVAAVGIPEPALALP